MPEVLVATRGRTGRSIFSCLLTFYRPRGLVLSVAGEQKCSTLSMKRVTHDPHSTSFVGDLAASDIVNMTQPKTGLFQHEYELGCN